MSCSKLSPPEAAFGWRQAARVPDVLGEHGWLVQSEDPSALAAAITTALESDDAARKVVEAKARLSREFGAEPWLDAYERIYDSRPSA